MIGGIEQRVLGVYGGSLWFFLRHKWVSAITWVACLVGTIYLFQLVPKSFLPVGDSGFMFGIIMAQQGSSPNQMHEYQTRAVESLAANPNVDLAVTVTGLSGFMQTNQGLMFAMLKDPKDRLPSAMTGEKHPSIQTVSRELAGSMVMQNPGMLAFIIPQPVLQIATGAASRSQGQFSYAISGVDPNEVYDTAQKLNMAFITQGAGKYFLPMMQGGVSNDMFLQTPQLKINILRDQAASYGISPTRIETLLRNAYSQNYIYLIKQPTNQYQVILETADQARSAPQNLELLYIKSDDGQRTVPLTAVAKWQPALGPQAVNHFNQFTSVTFNFNLMPGVALGDATDFIDQKAKEIVPQTMRADFQGDALTFRSTVSNLKILMLLAVFVMYVILAILYESYLHPLTVLSSLPVALIGGLATLLLFGQEASLYAYIGMFMLMGIVKKNGIMIVDFAIQRIAHGETAEKAIHEASMDRFRPIMMTTLAALMGAVPIALGFGADGESPAAGAGDRGWIDRQPVHYALHHAGDLSVSGDVPGEGAQPLCLFPPDDHCPRRRGCRPTQIQRKWSRRAGIDGGIRPVFGKQKLTAKCKFPFSRKFSFVWLTCSHKGYSNKEKTGCESFDAECFSWLLACSAPSLPSRPTPSRTLSKLPIRVR